MSIEYPENPENNVYYAYGTAGFEKGRVHRIEDASGAQELAYGPMGEIIRKTNSLVDLNQFTYTFSSFWQYDSWGRIRKIVYPDGEEVTYHYDPGGKLNAIHSSNGDSYLDDVYYDKFENKVMEALGNGTQMLYSYSADMRRLSELKAHYGGNYFLDVSYSYDQVGNITGIQNSAGSKDNLGGTFSHEYSYDALYRLTSANGTSGASHYDLEMAYSPSGNILSKMVAGQLTDIQQGSFPVHYINHYSYTGSAPHQVAGIVDQNSGTSFNFEWDLNGNMTLHSEMIQGISKQRRLCWDEENRLLLSADEEQLAGYVYDAAGMRTHKASGTTTVSTVNGQPSYFGNISSMTLYPSELITVSTGMYTKHYYNGSQRLASRIGGGFAPHPDLNHYDPLTDQVELPNSGDYQHKARLLVELWTRQAECAGLQPSLEFSYSLAEGNLHNPLSEPADGERYFYHSDHLGSSAFITSENGYATQFLAYLPFGETLNEEQNSSNYYSPFKFSAKEKDPETGYSYFGARYYSPELSVWLSVDQLSDAPLNIGWSPYAYVWDNPIRFIDPTGMHGESTHLDENGKVVAVFNDGVNGVYQHGKNADGGSVTEYQLSKRAEKKGTSSGGTKVGETVYWDEFVSPETGKTMTNYVLQIGKSFDPIIKEKAEEADKMDLMEIASESGDRGKFDIKIPYANVGALLNGKYATSRSAGNYLAGYNAESGTMFGVGISFTTFQKLAGGLHVNGSLTNKQKAIVVLFGTSYGPPPAYGEEMYQYRMSKAGWDASEKSNK